MNKILVRGDKEILIELVSAAGKQLAAGSLNVAELQQLLQPADLVQPLVTAASLLVGDEIPPPPTGIQMKSLPILNKAVGGLYGMVAVGGEPGAGKSTLALQVAVICGKDRPVLYYDLEQAGMIRLWQLGCVFKTADKVRELTQRIYFRESLNTLERDLMDLNTPVVVVVDSLQQLPTAANNRRTGLDAWIRKLVRLKARGHVIIFTSEVARDEYGNVSMKSFKETGEIEYAIDTGWIMLRPDPEDGTEAELYVVKNRYYNNLGHINNLRRRDGGWWFDEAKAHRREDEFTKAMQEPMPLESKPDTSKLWTPALVKGEQHVE